MLTGLDPGTTEAWKEGLRALAPFPNFYSKLSGLGTFVHRNDPETIAYIMDDELISLRQLQADVRVQLSRRKTLDKPRRSDCGASRGGHIA